jgi:phage host-nuclease inhibitor protein Gam
MMGRVLLMISLSYLAMPAPSFADRDSRREKEVDEWAKRSCEKHNLAAARRLGGNLDSQINDYCRTQKKEIARGLHMVNKKLEELATKGSQKCWHYARLLKQTEFEVEDLETRIQALNATMMNDIDEIPNLSAADSMREANKIYQKNMTELDAQIRALGGLRARVKDKRAGLEQVYRSYADNVKAAMSKFPGGLPPYCERARQELAQRTDTLAAEAGNLVRKSKSVEAGISHKLKENDKRLVALNEHRKSNMALFKKMCTPGVDCSTGDVSKANYKEGDPGREYWERYDKVAETSGDKNYQQEIQTARRDLASLAVKDPAAKAVTSIKSGSRDARALQDVINQTVGHNFEDSSTLFVTQDGVIGPRTSRSVYQLLNHPDPQVRNAFLNNLRSAGLVQ